MIAIRTHAESMADVGKTWVVVARKGRLSGSWVWTISADAELFEAAFRAGHARKVTRREADGSSSLLGRMA